MSDPERSAELFAERAADRVHQLVTQVAELRRGMDRDGNWIRMSLAQWTALSAHMEQLEVLLLRLYWHDASDFAEEAPYWKRQIASLIDIPGQEPT